MCLFVIIFTANNMSNIIKNLTNAARHFSSADFAVFKICLLSIGVLLGVYFFGFFLRHLLVVWGIAVITWLFLMFRIIHYFKKLQR